MAIIEIKTVNPLFACNSRNTLKNKLYHLLVVYRPISGENRGRKLLKKMGWKEGEGLGKDNAGITQPVCPCGAGLARVCEGSPFRNVYLVVK